VGKEVSDQQIAANNITLFQGKKEDLVSLRWNDKYDETDNNVICSKININDDQQNMTCQNENTIRMSKRHKKTPVEKEWWRFIVKKSYRKYINCNYNNGAINRVDDMPSSNKIGSRQQTTRNEAFTLYHQNICDLRRKINELITSFYVNTPCIWCFLTLSKTYKK
jgi:hypothetical protein